MPIEEKDNFYNPEGQEEISEMIGNSPGWLLHSGIGMVAFVTAILFVACALIKYPDKLQGRGALSSSNPPIEIVSNSSGYLQNILIKDLDQVEVGQELFYIDNTGSKEDVAKLKAWFDQFNKTKNLNGFSNLAVPKDLMLGTVQNDYTAIVLKYKEFQQAIRNQFVFKEIDNITKEIEDIEKLKVSQKKEKEIVNKELLLLKKSFERAQGLYKEGVESLSEVEKAKSTLLQKEGIFESMEKEIINNNIRVKQLDLEKIRLQKDRNELLENNKFKIVELISNAENKIQNWSEQYIVRAKIGGEINFENKLVENKFINANDVLASIIPKNNIGNFLSIKAPIENIGKIEVGQRVIIKFDAFPYKEFGIVESKVSSIGKIPEVLQDGRSYYEIKASISDAITTDYNKNIPFKPDMTAHVDIITQDKTIATRILNQLMAVSK